MPATDYLQWLHRLISLRRKKRPFFHPEFEELEQRNLLTAGLIQPLQFDFGSPLSPVAQNAIDVQLVNYTPEQGHGWQDTTGLRARDRAVGDDQRRDLHLGTDGTFVVDLANGTYDIKPLIGDSVYHRDRMNLWLEGKLVGVNLAAKAGQYVQPTYRVTVADGQLTLRIADLGGDTKLFGIAGLDVTPVLTQPFTSGSYINWPLQDPLTSALTSDPGVTGILLAVTWDEVEGQADGTFDWSLVDARVQEAAAAGLKVTLKILNSTTDAPSWILSNSQVQTIGLTDTNKAHSTYLQTVTAPVFWDPIFHQERIELIQAAGERYSGNSAVVGFTTAFANWSSDDMDIPAFKGTIRRLTLDQPQQWIDAGYTTEKMLTVGQQILDASAAAFPNQGIKIALQTVKGGLDATSTTLASQILDYAYAQSYGSRFYAQINFLNTQNPLASDPSVNAADPDSITFLFKLLKDHGSQVGFQMVSSATDCPHDGYRLNKGVKAPIDEILQHAVNIALSYQPTFIEYWTEDGENPDLYSIIQSATESMQDQ